MTARSNRFIYGGRPAEVQPAAGVRGLVLREIGGALIFRVRTGEDFTDYRLRHEDLSITIDPGELATFYRVGDDHILDQSPEALGLARIEE